MNRINCYISWIVYEKKVCLKSLLLYWRCMFIIVRKYSFSYVSFQMLFISMSGLNLKNKYHIVVKFTRPYHGDFSTPINENENINTLNTRCM